MTIAEIIEFTGIVLRVLLSEEHVRSSLLITTIAVLVYAFFTNHLSVRRLLIYAGLFLIVSVGEEMIRMDYRMHVQGITDHYLLIFPVIFSVLFYFCVWLGFALGFALNRTLYVSFDDPYGRLARVLEGMAQRLRDRSASLSAEDIRSWDQLRAKLEEKAATPEAEGSVT